MLLSRPASIVDSIKAFARRVDHDPTLIEYERVVYKAALDAQGANVDRICEDATADSHVMFLAVAARTASTIAPQETL